MERTRSSFKRKYTNQDIYRSYVSHNGGRKSIFPKQGDMLAVLNSVFMKIFKEILYNAYHFKYRNLGVFKLIKFYPEVKETEDGKIITNKVIDRLATKNLIRETGDKSKRVYYTNEETDGYIYRVAWDTSMVTFSNKTFYKFKLNRTLKKLVHEAIMKGEAMATLVHFKL